MKIIIPLVSVVVLTYNQENTLNQTLESIFSQVVDFDFEVIIGEDYSTDSTRQVCISYKEKYPDKITLLLHEKNKGLLRNYQSVLKACKGKYIAQCAGDDYWHNVDKLQLQVNFLEQNIDYGLVHTGYICYNIKTETKDLNINIKTPVGSVFDHLLFEGNFICATTVMFRKELLEKIDFSSYISKGFLTEDYPMWIDFSRFTNFHYIAQDTITYRLNENSASQFDKFEKSLFFLENIFLIRKDFLDKFPNELKRGYLENQFNKERLSLALRFRNIKSVTSAARVIKSNTVESKIKMIIFSYPFSLNAYFFVKDLCNRIILIRRKLF